MALSSTTGLCHVEGRIPNVVYEGEVQYCCASLLSYVSFLGIPYAEIPAGLKRYQKPEKLTSINPAKLEAGPSPSIFRANQTGPKCTQITAEGVEGSPDCLYLNIYLPKKPEQIEEPLPVLVFIHGGGFALGSNDPEYYSAHTIVQHGVVFVTINYRLGLLGFLNTRSKECVGNAGLKDQVMALEWIRDNIACFKGDPGNVTLSGWSAGATCVNLHLVSQQSQNLFHKAIIQSGGIHSSWGFKGHKQEQKNLLLGDRKCRDLIFAEEETKEFQEYAFYLLAHDRQTRHPESLAPIFGPSVEKFKDDAFIPQDVTEMMKMVNCSKPVMAGVTRNEGIYLFLANPRENYAEMATNDRRLCKFLMDNLRWSPETAEANLERIRNKYFPNRFSLSLQAKENRFAKLFHDVCFRRFYDNFKFGPEKTLPENFFVYMFDYFSELSLGSMHGDPLSRSATHGDEIRHLYCTNESKYEYRYEIFGGRNPSIQIVMQHLGSLWASFCRNGIPRSNVEGQNVAWRRHTAEKPCYMRISRSLELVEGSLFQDDWRWLNELVDPLPTIPSDPSTPDDE